MEALLERRGINASFIPAEMAQALLKIYKHHRVELTEMGRTVMGKYKESPKYNVLSIRITDDEKAVIDEMIRDTRKSVSMLMREAMLQYTLPVDGAANR